VNRHQRTRARSVNCLARPVQIEKIGDAVGKHRMRVAGRTIGFYSDPVGRQQIRVVVCRYAGKEPGLSPGNIGFLITSVLQAYARRSGETGVVADP